MTTPATKLTYHDYLLLPDDGKRYEILEGELYMTPSLVDPDANSVETLVLQADRFVRGNLVTPPASCTSPLFPDLKIDLGWLLK